MQVPTVRPPSAKRRSDGGGSARPTIAKRRHSIETDPAALFQRAAPVEARRSNNNTGGKSVEDELDEIPTGDELDLQMKLFGRLHDEAFAEWLGLGQPSTIAEDLCLEAQERRKAELLFLQKHEALLGDERDRIALLPPDVVEELRELELLQLEQARRELAGSQQGGAEAAALALLEKRRRDNKRKKTVMMVRERGLGDGRMLDSDEDDDATRDEVVDDDANIVNSWEAAVALRRALLSSGIASAHDEFVYSATDGAEDNAELSKRSATSGSNRQRRAPLSRQLLGLTASARGASSRDGSARVYDAATGEELFDENEFLGKEPGEPVFIPPEPRFVGRCTRSGGGANDQGGHDDDDDDRQKAAVSKQQRKQVEHFFDDAEDDAHCDGESECGEEDAENDDQDGERTPDARSLGVMAIDAAARMQNHEQRPVSSQLPPLSELLLSLDANADGPFEKEMAALLQEARGHIAEMTTFVYKVEQDFWTEAQQRSLTRKTTQYHMMGSSGGAGGGGGGSSGGGPLDLSMLVRESREEQARLLREDGEREAAELFFPGRGPPAEALPRVRAFLEQLVHQVDGVLSEEVPEDDDDNEGGSNSPSRRSRRRAAAAAGGLLPSQVLRAEARAEARRAKAASKAGVAVGAAAPASTALDGGDSNLSMSMSMSMPMPMSVQQSANVLLSTEQTTTNTGVLGAAVFEDRRYAVVLNIATQVCDALLHRDCDIVQRTGAHLEDVIARMRELTATCVAHVLLRDEALGEVHTVLRHIQAVVRAAARVAVHAQDEVVFRGVAETFVAAARRMQEFSRDVARIGEEALLDAAELRKRLAATAREHERMVVALLELSDSMETQPLGVPRHAQWRRRALDELFRDLHCGLSTLSSLEVASDERADALVSSSHVALHIRDLVVRQRRPFSDVALLYYPEDKDASVLAGVALAIAARRRLRELGRGMDGTWRFSVF